MLPQEVEMLPENDLIVFRRGMYATYGKKVRYYEEKKLAARTKIPAPEMPTIPIDPAIARNSLRVIQAAEAEGEAAIQPASVGRAPSPASSQPGAGEKAGVPINRSAVQAALAVPPGARTKELFDHLVSIKARAA
jgi:type IV secretion system protein VirD4